MRDVPTDRRVALVTGAAGGIGRAVAERLARAGWRLVLHARTSDERAEAVAAACRSHGAEVLVAPGELRDPVVPDALCDRALEAFGRLDLLVNNAGVSRPALLLTLDDPALAELVETNVLAVVRMTRAALKPMLRQRRGVVVNVSSVLTRHPSRGSAVYAGTKGFVEAFTRSVAVEVGRKNVRVNAVAPGIIETDMTRGVRAHAGDQLPRRSAMRRLGQPAEVADVIAFLASDAAAYVNGAVLPVDGAYLGGEGD